MARWKATVNRLNHACVRAECEVCGKLYFTLKEARNCEVHHKNAEICRRVCNPERRTEG